MILRGWKSICSSFGGMSEKTARKLMREEGLPVVYIAGTPMSTPAALEEWVHDKCKRQQREHEKQFEDVEG